MKEFLMLIRESVDYGNMTAEDMQGCIEEHITWVNGLIEKGQYKLANPLDDKGASIKNGVVTDGPYIESKECISGFYILLASSLEEAVGIAKTCPDVARGNTIEIRQITEVDDPTT